jgi:ribosomal protein L24E
MSDLFAHSPSTPTPLKQRGQALKKAVLTALWLAAASVLATVAPATPAEAATGSGYLMVSADGRVHRFGSAPFCGHSDMVSSRQATDVEVTPNGQGYWILVSGGYVDFKDCGMPSDDWRKYVHNNSVRLNVGERAVSLSVLPDGTGYWVFTDRGRAIPFGNAQFYGDMANVPLNGPVLGSVATPKGTGYWMVASDGGIFAFGDAKFSGSTGNLKLNKPVMSMAPDPDGTGYWLVASDGGIFAFDANFKGSMGGTKLNKPVSGMVPGPNGYLMVAEDGGIFAFGDVAFHGSLGATPSSSPITAVALWDGDPTFQTAGPDAQPQVAIPPPPPAPVTEWREVATHSGSKGTDTPIFAMGGGRATMTWACLGSGSYAGGCHFAVRSLADGSLLDSMSADANASGTTNLHPDAAGWYYVEVNEFNTGSTGWSFTIDQETCVANCPAGQAAPTVAPSWSASVTQKSGNTNTDTASFWLADRPAKMEWSCQGSGSYAGGCHFAVRSLADGSLLDSMSADANASGTMYLHPTTSGQYYVEVDEFNTGVTTWSFAITQVP